MKPAKFVCNRVYFNQDTAKIKAVLPFKGGIPCDPLENLPEHFSRCVSAGYYCRYCCISLQSNPTIPKSQESIPQSTQVSYFLREYDGKIGVFQGETTLPFEILDVYVSNLPSVDQMELRSGIEILTKEELSAKIEDYGS